MRDFEYSYESLLKIFNEDLPFHLAISSTLKKNKSEKNCDLKSTVSASAGAALRHFYVLKEIIERQYQDLENEKMILIALAISDRLFSKQFVDEEEELLQFVKMTTEIDDVIEFIKGRDNPKNIIPEDIIPQSRKYYSLRYNIPLWIVRMWEKNAPILSKRLYRSLTKKDVTLVRVNNQEISNDEFFEKNSQFIKHDEEGIAVYKENVNFRKTDAFKNEEILNISSGYKLMLNDLDVDEFRGIAVFSEENNDLLKELYVRFGCNLKLDYLCGSQKVFFETKNATNHFRMKDVALYETSAEAIVTCVSKPVHTFFVCPKNSNFNALIHEPDYFLRCKQEDMDLFNASENMALSKASEQVEEGGYLVYFIPTFSRNEGRKVINNFLKEHNNFSLEKETQLFPFDKYGTMLYFAILRKGNTND